MGQLLLFVSQCMDPPTPQPNPIHSLLPCQTCPILCHVTFPLGVEARRFSPGAFLYSIYIVVGEFYKKKFFLVKGYVVTQSVIIYYL